MRNQIISTLSAVVLGLSLGMPAMATTFTDDANIGEWSKESVDILQSLDIMVGYPDGTFQPQWAINREEYAVSLLKGLSTLEGMVTEAYTANDTFLYEELVAQQVTLLDALAAIDELKAKDAVEKNNYVAIGMGYSVGNNVSNDVSTIQILGKVQVVELSDTFAISVRPFVTSDATGGATVTLDTAVTDKLTMYAGGGVASNWGTSGQLTGTDDVVGIVNAGAEYDLSKKTVAGVDVKLPTDGANQWDPTITGFVGLKF